jgi:hypothetical protein
MLGLTRQQHELRRNVITATDVPKILGVSPWGDQLSVWLSKVRPQQPEPMSQPAEVGLRIERALAQWWCDHNGHELLEVRDWLPCECDEGNTIIGPEPWMAATPDFLARHQVTTELVLIECKRRRYAAGWDEPRNMVPEDIALQCMWQLDVVRYHLMDIKACIVVGDIAGDWCSFRIDYDNLLMRNVVAACREFWQRVESDKALLAEGKRPMPPEPSTYTPDNISRWIEARYPEPLDGELVLSGPDMEPISDLVEQLADIADVIEELKGTQSELRAKLELMMGPHDSLKHERATITFRPNMKHSTAWKAIVESVRGMHDIEDVINQHTRETHQRVLRFRRRK